MNHLSDLVIVAGLAALTLVLLAMQAPAALRTLRIRREASEFDGSMRASASFTAPEGHHVRVSLDHQPEGRGLISDPIVRRR